MTTANELEAVIEAVLFASNEPVAMSGLREVFPDEAGAAVDAAFAVVCERYRGGEESRGVFIEEVAGGHRLVTRPQLHGYLRKYFDVTGHNRLSMASLETLAIVAYRQPVTGPEIQEMRGVNSSGVLKTLLDRRLIRISGRKQVVGKPFIYRTTREFLMHFGLKDIEDLPPLEEFEESFGALETELDLGSAEKYDPYEEE
jgi:segregation and condensation protein B